MRRMANQIIFAAMGLSFLTGSTQAAKLTCPDAMDHRDVMATSAPEIKVRAGIQETRQWAEIIKPLTQKAILLAKTQRATDLEDGIERACPASQIFVGQLIPVPNKPSGCEHRVITRAAGEGHLWVQVVATCKYDWGCCTPEGKMSRATASSSDASVGYTLEGPLAGNMPETSTATATTPTKHRQR